MWFRQLAADTIEMEAIHINMLYTGTRLPVLPVTSSTPVIRNIHCSNITCTFSKGHAVEILGLPESLVENVTLDSVSMQAARGIACVDARGVTFTKVHIKADSCPVVELTDCDHVTLNSMSVPSNADPFLLVGGARSDGIVILNSSVRNAKTALQLGDETPRRTGSAAACRAS